MLVAGGEGTTGFLSSAELYNPSTGRWSVTGSMATSRLGQSAALLPNGLVLVAGGIVNIIDTGVVAVTASAELYNPSTGQWTPAGSLNTARYSAGTALLQGGQVLVAAGVNPTMGHSPALSFTRRSFRSRLRRKEEKWVSVSAEFPWMLLAVALARQHPHNPLTHAPSS